MLVVRIKSICYFIMAPTQKFSRFEFPAGFCNTSGTVDWRRVATASYTAGKGFHGRLGSSAVMKSRRLTAT
jgi:hypothetical protein